MAKRTNYANLFTLRKDGRYQTSYVDDKGRHYIYDRDPEKLWEKLQALQEKKETTFADVANLWELEHREEITVRTWSNYAPHYSAIIHKHGKKSFSSVTALDVVNHLSQAKSEGYSATVVNSIRSLYRMIFDYAVVHGYAAYNPVSSIKLPRGLHRGKRIAPTDEQISIICANVDKPFGLFPFFLLCTGVRKSEALALNWDDINFIRREINISKSLDYTNGAKPKIKAPKTEAGIRIIPIVDVLYEQLQKAYAQRTYNLVFPSTPSNKSKGGELMPERAYEGAWLRYCRSVGLINSAGKPSITAHNLRHGTATLLFEAGVDELTTQKILGHSRIEITREIYTDLRLAKAKESFSKFNSKMNNYLCDEK